MKQQYDSYKPSGIDWIGDIPSHWKLPRVKQFVKINNGSDPKTEGDIPVYGSGSCSFKTCGEFKLGPTVLLGRKGATLHIPHWIEGKYWNVDTAFDTNIIGDLNLRLFFYFSMLFNYEKYKSETTLPSMTQTDYGNMYIPLPPLSEQEAIAAWLDEKCEEIDAAIAKVDREIELIDELKQSEISRVVTRGLNPDAHLRPSGIDWIGDIPKHWEVCKVKHKYHIQTGFTPATKNYEYYDLDNGYTWITIGDIKEGTVSESSNKISSKYIEEFAPQPTPKGSLLYSFKLSVGQVSFAGADLYTNEAIASFINSENINLSFLKYSSSLIVNNANINIYGAPILNQELIKNAPIVFPPLSEQQEIADYLDKKCAEIDGLKAKLTKKRETLTELRQSIISEVVTGKHKVI